MKLHRRGHATIEGLAQKIKQELLAKGYVDLVTYCCLGDKLHIREFNSIGDKYAYNITRKEAKVYLVHLRNGGKTKLEEHILIEKEWKINSGRLIVKN